jgi:hypothetical protein
MHPAHKLLEWLPQCDFAVFGHGFAEHQRDYVVVVQDSLGAKPGTHRIVFTHCVRADCESRVRDDVWPRSWTDEFTDYDTWMKSGEPEGYVWGSKWSMAYPGISFVEVSPAAEEWKKRIGREFYEISFETDRFLLRLIFHDIVFSKLGDSTDVISKVVFPIDEKKS